MGFDVRLASAYGYGGYPTIAGVTPLFMGYESPYNDFHGKDIRAGVQLLDAGYDPNDPKSWIACEDPAALKAVADYVKQQGLDSICLDLEHPGGNPLASRRNISNHELYRIIDDLHGYGLKVSVYGAAPLTDADVPATHDLCDRLDFLTPSAYPYTRRWTSWAQAWVDRLKRIKKAYPNKPCLPCLTFTGTNTSGDGQAAIPWTEYVGDDAVYLMLTVARDHADGAALWLGFDGTTNQPYGKYPGDKGLAVVQQFLGGQ